ncbi:heterokaryon incompatibility protein-domain-containing protein [Apodospora peruviana]|uniref:Heterokaryon incompatibility protein-domain-containing protein n=1 Tax=Apodospora peruviana TaxID=516989 RepID=A0AAE0HZG1_9PEZI|nr:heterokaryon incompatibility protein-domain-containing protein [Apodospora peruviana]
MAFQSSFPYQPLPANDARFLRVLRITPGEASSPLVCKLEHAICLPEDPDNLRNPKTVVEDTDNPLVGYEALSYCWGDPTHTDSITLNSLPFGISANLSAALHQLRKPDVERILWVDAICIDQSSDSDKKREVSRMRAIYYSAKSVAIWLGPSSPTSNDALNFAEEMYSTFRFVCDQFGVGSSGEGAFDWIDEQTRLAISQKWGFLSPDRTDDWKALHELFGRPWFGRAWTLQELIVSRDAVVICGDRSVPWMAIEVAALVADVTYWHVHQLISDDAQYKLPGYLLDFTLSMVRTRTSYRHLDNKRNINGLVGPGASFSRAEGASTRLTNNTSRGCSLPHDKIYSVIGILPPPLRDAIQPDYSLPALEMYKRAVQACIRTTGWLNIICHSQYSEWYPPSHPSWLPDWTRPPRGTVFAERSSALMPPHRPVKERKAEGAFISEDLSVLTVRGFVVGVVEVPGVEELGGCFPGLRKASQFLAVDGPESRKWRDCVYPSTYPEFQYIPNAPADVDHAWVDGDPVIWDFEEDFRTTMGVAFNEKIRYPFFRDVLEIFLGRLKELCEASVRNDDPTHQLDYDAVDTEREGEFGGFYNKVRGHLMSRTIFLWERVGDDGKGKGKEVEREKGSIKEAEVSGGMEGSTTDKESDTEKRQDGKESRLDLGPGSEVYGDLLRVLSLSDEEIEIGKSIGGLQIVATFGGSESQTQILPPGDGASDNPSQSQHGQPAVVLEGRESTEGTEGAEGAKGTMGPVATEAAKTTKTTEPTEGTASSEGKESDERKGLHRGEEAMLGIGPDFVERGDLVCLLFGCDAPVVLRRKEDGRYMFVGDAHVYGLMDGKGMEMLERGEVKVVDFEIV